MSGTCAIELVDVTVGYGRHAVLEDVSLRVHQGEFLALVGPNGGGKTTLLRTVLGLVKPWRGRVSVVGRSAWRGRTQVGYVPQAIEFDPDFPISALDVVHMGRLRPRNLTWPLSRRDRLAADQALDRVGLSHLARRPIGELSGGQRQRVYLARALAAQPQILLLDEPTAQVDPESRGVVFQLLRELNLSATTIVMVSHDVDAVAAWCHSVACIDRRLYVPPPGSLIKQHGHVHLPPHRHGEAPADPVCDPSVAMLDPFAVGAADEAGALLSEASHAAPQAGVTALATHNGARGTDVAQPDDGIQMSRALAGERERSR